LTQNVTILHTIDIEKGDLSIQGFGGDTSNIGLVQKKHWGLGIEF
jgi:hypothetical protein